jgi:hypothetical protein
LYLAFGCGALAVAIDWPVVPQNQSQPLGNSYGEYQNYGGYPYFHPGIDIMAPAGTPVYAIKAGYVKAVLTISAELHWRVAIGDSAGAAECDGWLYAHLDEGTIAVMEGEWIEEGQYLGDLVYWPVADFHHLHFVKIRNSGIVWSSDWEFIANPLDELEVIDDDQPPQFSNAYGTNLFAFCQNESASYFAEGETIAGDVDIICRVDDMINHFWLLAPYRMEYRIDGDSSIPWTNSVCFTGPLDWSNNIDVVYQDDSYCDSRGDYDYRWYYFNLTNTDGDSLIEASDRMRSWQTANFQNGIYTVYARAYDRAGNVSTASMDISVANYYTLNGSVTYSDGDPYQDGTVISILPDGPADTTDSEAAFSIHMVGGGSQTIRAERVGYASFDTTLMMNQHHQLDIFLTATYVQGDANFDGEINLGDAVYIINYVFKGGPDPQPYLAGDANSDGLVDIGDAVYLINYIFHNGPLPSESQSSYISRTW